MKKKRIILLGLLLIFLVGCTISALKGRSDSNWVKDASAPANNMPGNFISGDNSSMKYEITCLPSSEDMFKCKYVVFNSNLPSLVSESGEVCCSYKNTLIEECAERLLDDMADVPRNTTYSLMNIPCRYIALHDYNFLADDCSDEYYITEEFIRDRSCSCKQYRKCIEWNYKNYSSQCLKYDRDKLLTIHFEKLGVMETE